MPLPEGDLAQPGAHCLVGTSAAVSGEVRGYRSAGQGSSVGIGCEGMRAVGNLTTTVAPKVTALSLQPVLHRKQNILTLPPSIPSPPPSASKKCALLFCSHDPIDLSVLSQGNPTTLNQHPVTPKDYPMARRSSETCITRPRVGQEVFE